MLRDEPEAKTKKGDTKMKATIKYANGEAPIECNNLSDAYAGLQEEFPDCHIEQCGDRHLCWESEEESYNDDGSKAVAEIIEE